MKNQTPHQKKIAQIMHEFAVGELHEGKTETIVTNRKQAIAIAMNEADEIKTTSKRIL